MCVGGAVALWRNKMREDCVVLRGGRDWTATGGAGRGDDGDSCFC